MKVTLKTPNKVGHETVDYNDIRSTWHRVDVPLVAMSPEAKSGYRQILLDNAQTAQAYDRSQVRVDEAQELLYLTIPARDLKPGVERVFELDPVAMTECTFYVR